MYSNVYAHAYFMHALKRVENCRNRMIHASQNTPQLTALRFTAQVPQFQVSLQEALPMNDAIAKANDYHYAFTHLDETLAAIRAGTPFLRADPLEDDATDHTTVLLYKCDGAWVVEWEYNDGNFCNVHDETFSTYGDAVNAFGYPPVDAPDIPDDIGYAKSSGPGYAEYQCGCLRVRKDEQGTRLV